MPAVPPPDDDKAAHRTMLISLVLDRMRVVALLVAAGQGYHHIARTFRVPPEEVYRWAKAGALLLQRSGDVPEYLAHDLAHLPPLEPPPPVRRRPRRTPDLATLPPLPDLDDLVIPYPDLADLAPDPLVDH